MAGKDNCRQCGRKLDAGQNFCGSCGASVIAELDVTDPHLGRLIADKFRVDSVIGSGSMGMVYRATQVALNKVVAIKILRKRLLGDALVARRFKQEARAASRLNHPNSIQILDFGELPDGELFMAMEYVEGTDLAAIIQEDAPLPTKRIAHILSQACSALYEAHVNGVLHRDLKPANILVSSLRSRKDFVKVLDFGIAKMLDPDPGTSAPVTRDGFVCGTPAFMSPEQVQGFELDHRTDIFSLGIILYQAMTGRLPFKAPSPLEMATKIVMEPVVPPSKLSLDGDVDPELEVVALRALEKSVDDRYQTALELMEALEALGEGASPAGGPEPPALRLLKEIEDDLDAGRSVVAAAKEEAERAEEDCPTPLPATSLETPGRIRRPAASDAPTLRRTGPLEPPKRKPPTPSLTPAGEPNRAHLDLPPASRKEGDVAAWDSAETDVLATRDAIAEMQAPRRRRLIGLGVVAAVVGFAVVTALLEVLFSPAGDPPAATEPEVATPAPPAEVRAPGKPSVEVSPLVSGQPEPKEKRKVRKARRKARSKRAKRLRKAARGKGKTAKAPPKEPEEPAVQSPRARARALLKEAGQLVQDGESKPAIAKLKQAVRLDPKLAEAYRVLGKLYMRSNHAVGVKYYRRYLKLAPKGPDAATARRIVDAFDRKKE